MTEIYAAYNKDIKTRESSSSGGVFSILAENVIRQKGVVWGTAFDADLHVVHKRVTTANELSLLRGSKYVYSKLTKDMLVSIKEDLQNGITVLFCGTPCQISIVTSFIGKELRKGLLAIDFTCHGTPPPEVWNAYLAVLKSKGEIKSINMRDKKYGWKTYSLRVDYVNGKTFSEIFTWNHYMQAFLENVSLRKPCYNCPFKGVKPQSDITLADYWNVSNKHPEINSLYGVSKIYVHSESGRRALTACKQSLFVGKDAEIDNFFTPKIVLSIPPTRNLFFKALKVEGFEAAYKKAVCKGLLWSAKMEVKGFVKICLYLLHQNKQQSQ